MKEDFYYFWGGALSQWYPCDIVIDGITYCTAEQYMMAQKALLFDDYEIYNKIMKTFIPKVQKQLGRKIKNFNSETWNEHCKDIVFNGNYAKFTQNKCLKSLLLETGDKTIVEASSLDTIWGIGLDENDPLAWDKETWKGTNFLGEILTNVREKIKSEVNNN